MHLHIPFWLTRSVFACLLVIAFAVPAMAETRPTPASPGTAAEAAKPESKPTKPDASAQEPRSAVDESESPAEGEEAEADKAEPKDTKTGVGESSTGAPSEPGTGPKANAPVAAPSRKPEAAEAAKPAGKQILVNIDKTTQAMTVFVDGIEEHRWPVSTGAYGYTTPSGSYTATSMNEIWYSKQWDNAPMPHAIFFTKKGHAVHGSKEVKKLGTPASHGCVRLSPKNAKALFTLVKANGLENTQVVIDGETPGGEAVVASQPRQPGYGEYQPWAGQGYYPPPPYGWGGRKRRGYAVAPPPGWYRPPPRRGWFQRRGYYQGY